MRSTCEHRMIKFGYKNKTYSYMCSTPSYFGYSDKQRHETNPWLDVSRKTGDQIELLLAPFHTFKHKISLSNSTITSFSID